MRRFRNIPLIVELRRGYFIREFNVMRYGWIWMVLTVAAALTACAPSTGSGPEVTEVIEEPIPSPTPANCTALPEDMTFSVSPRPPDSVLISMTGLQSDEEPVVVLYTGTQDHFRRIEEFVTSPVGKTGVFETEIEGVRPLDDEQSAIWQVKVIHSRGVACDEITVP